jgi:Uma2 family endonuclease
MALLSEERRLTLVDLIERFGPMPAHRIRSIPPPGLATVEDLLRINGTEEGLWELVDGVLVEKTMGYFESRLATVLAYLLSRFLEDSVLEDSVLEDSVLEDSVLEDSVLEGRDLGIVLGADAASRFAQDLVRIPDVSFVSWSRLPERKTPREPLPDLVPDLAVEILSSSNTPQEMDRKLKDYFRTGVGLVWYVDPDDETVRVYTSPERSRLLKKDDTLDGGAVLPGFSVPIAEWFDKAR